MKKTPIIETQTVSTKVDNTLSNKTSNQSTFAECSKKWAKMRSEATQEVAVVEAEIVTEDIHSKLLVVAKVNEVQSISNSIVPMNQYQDIKQSRGTSLMQEMREYLEYDFALDAANDLLIKNLLNAHIKVKTLDGEEDDIFKLLQKYNDVEIYDPIEPDKTGTLKHGNIFDAEYISHSRDNEVAKVIFPAHMITHILRTNWGHSQNSTFLLKALADNIAISGFSESSIKSVINVLVNEKYLPEYNSFKNDIKKAKWRGKRFTNKIPEHELEALYLLQDYAFLNDKGNMKFIDLNADSYQTISKSNLMLLFANRNIEVVDEDTGRVKTVNPVILYLESKHRKEYRGVVFDPSNKHDSSIYNLFKGYKIEAIKGTTRIQKFKDFVKAIICRREELMFNIVWSFFAQIFQKPYEKKGTALIMVSKEGAGKGTLMKTIAKLMGGYYLSSTDHKHIVSPFNKHLEQTLLFYANEAKFTDNSFTVSKLKNIITETDATSEIKGGDTYATSNYTHLVIDGNDGIPVEQSEDSRRFLNIFVDESKIGNQAYWDEINAEINTDGFYEALMYDLMNFDYSEWEHFLRTPPKVEVTNEQIQENFDAVVAWWTACLVDARIPYIWYELTPDDKLNVRNEDMFQSFKKWCSINGYKHRLNNSTFGKEFREQALGQDSGLDRKLKITINGERKHSHVYAEVDVCRESFAKRKQLNNMDYNGSEWKLPQVS